jgi:hypothetical protein
VFDKSGYSNNGTITGATWSKLKSGLWTIYHDGVDDVCTTTDTGGLLASSTMSGLMWIKFVAFPDANPCIMGKKATTYNQANGWQVFYESAVDLINFRGSSGNYEVSGAVGVSAGTWFLFGFVAVGTSVTIYVNGVSKGARAIDAISSNTDQFRIGKLSNDYPSLANFYWQGARIINGVALSASTIAEIYRRERRLFGV